MNDSDTSQRFLLNDNAIRGQWTLLDSSFQNVLAKHEYPLEIQTLLGELMAAAVLLTATLKFEGSLTIQARGEGPLRLITVECTDTHHLRAVARWEGDTQGLDFKALLGNAILAITITPSKGERYQGIVPLTGDSVAECLEFYFTQSEQLRTRIWLYQGNNRAGGMLLQVLPYHSGVEVDPAQQAEEWNRLSLLANTLTADELLNLDSQTLLHRLFHEEDVLIFPPEPVDFRCTCSRERTASSLAQIGREELDSILEEQGRLDVTCQFCNQQYIFDSVDVAMLFQPSPGSDGGQRH